MTHIAKIAHLRNMILITLGTAIYAFGLHYFIIPNELMEGGVTGIALLLKYVFDFRPSLTTLLINIPLFYIGWRFFGKKAMFFTVYGTVAVSFFLWMMELLISKQYIQPFIAEQDFILAALYAGLTLGAGLGIVFRYGGTTGGVDILARIGQQKRGWSMGKFIFTIDVFVIGSSIFYIPLVKVLYTIVTVFIVARVIDYIMEGTYAANAFMIMTKHPQKIASEISEQLGRGATFLNAIGAYTQKEHQVVYCVVYRNEIRRMQEIIKMTDPTAFIIISKVHDVFGEGFKGE